MACHRLTQVSGTSGTLRAEISSEVGRASVLSQKQTKREEPGGIVAK